ncbi:MAG: hypothetical protein U0X40_02830 [Ferruginibacter sp.]
MKMLRQLTTLFALLLFIAGCQKALNLGDSMGFLQKSIMTGNCDPVTINGLFIKDSTLSNANYVDIRVNVQLGGSFIIKTDTVNGFSFYKEGTIGPGDGTIRLYPSGKPLATGPTTFTVHYDTSYCTFTVNVIASGTGVAVFDLLGSPGNCTGAVSSGTYTAGIPLTAANTVTCTVNVTVPGTYSITTSTNNGISFSGSGVFVNPGIQTVTLSGTGTPTANGNFNYTPVSTTSGCTFTITVGAGAPPSALFVLGGAPGACTGVTLSGTYQASIPTTAANTVKVDVTVTTAGTYSLTTPVVNGIKFSTSGIFTSTGPQQVTLMASSASPVAAGSFDYPISGATSSTCTFSVVYAAAPPPAAYTLSGAPGSCANISVAGTYTAGTALTSANKVTVEVNVTTAGAYSLSTDLQNGMKFTAGGTFTSTGIQTVTLLPTAGSNPTAAGSNTFTVTAPTTSCTFDITAGAPSDRKYSFQIGSTTYSGPCSAFLIGGGSGSETMNIFDAGTPGVTLTLNLNNPSGAITTGFYSGSSSSGKYTDFQYIGSVTLLASPGAGLTNLSANVTSIDVTNRVITGTFSGTVLDFSATVRTITNGTFKADY